MYYKEKDICEFFSLLNDNVVYILANNIGNELPKRLVKGKDIDIIVHPDYYEKLKKLLHLWGYRKIIHPYGEDVGWKYLYGMRKAYKYRHINSGIEVDVYDCLCTKSAMMNAWLPLDKKINANIWMEKQWDSKNKWWILDDATMLVYLITRCVFEKNSFSELYKMEIEKRKQYLANKVLIEKLESVFFKFTSVLIKLIQDRKYYNIISRYYSFVDY